MHDRLSGDKFRTYTTRPHFSGRLRLLKKKKKNTPTREGGSPTRNLVRRDTVITEDEETDKTHRDAANVEEGRAHACACMCVCIKHKFISNHGNRSGIISAQNARQHECIIGRAIGEPFFRAAERTSRARAHLACTCKPLHPVHDMRERLKCAASLLTQRFLRAPFLRTYTPRNASFHLSRSSRNFVGQGSPSNYANYFRTHEKPPLWWANNFRA